MNTINAATCEEPTKRKNFGTQRVKASWLVMMAGGWLGLVGMWCGQAQAQAPTNHQASDRAFRAEVRGLAQMVMLLRKELAKLKQQHAASMQQIKKQHAKALRKLRQQLAQQGTPKTQPAPTTRTTPPSQAGIHALKRQVKLLSHQVEALRIAVKRNQKRLQQPNQGSHRYAQPRRSPRTSIRHRLPKPQLTVSGREYAKGFYMLTFTPNRQVLQIEYRLAHMKGFRTTGVSHVRNPTTGKPYPKMYIMTRHLKKGWNKVDVRFQMASGRWSPIRTHKLQIQSKSRSDADLFLRYQWSNPILRQVRYRLYRGKLWFLFFWSGNAKIFKRASYSFGSPSLHNHFIVNGNKTSSILTRTGLTPGKYSLYARFKLANGTHGPLLEYKLRIKADGKWYNASP